MNKVFLIGNLTRDPELTAVGQENLQKCRFTLAVPRPRSKDKEVDFVDVVAWRNLAENCQKYLKKGSKCAVVGYLTIREFTSKDGAKKRATEIVADDVEFLSRPQQTKQTSGYEQQGLTPIDNDDSLPF